MTSTSICLFCVHDNLLKETLDLQNFLHLNNIALVEIVIWETRVVTKLWFGFDFLSAAFVRPTPGARRRSFPPMWRNIDSSSTALILLKQGSFYDFV